jgi:hypothetical protein
LLLGGIACEGTLLAHLRHSFANALTATVTPRPIASVTTLSKSGVVNAAPHRIFKVMGHESPRHPFRSGRPQEYVGQYLGEWE